MSAETPPNASVINARDDDEDVILASESNPIFWLDGVIWLLLLCLVNNSVPHGPEVTTALNGPLDAVQLPIC